MVNYEKLVRELTRDEGLRLKVYRCTAGRQTIGIGRNLDNVGLRNAAEAEFLLKGDIAAMEVELDAHLPWWRQLDPVRQRAMLNWAFNIGVVENDGKLLTFKNSLRLLQEGKYLEASQNMLASKWARDVGIGTPEKPGRALRVTLMMRDGASGKDLA
jgi:lysozyme